MARSILNPPPPETRSEIVYDCAECLKPIAIDARAAGMSVDCPYCGASAVVPAANEAVVIPKEAAAEPEAPAHEAPVPEAPAELAEEKGGGGLPKRRAPGELPKGESVEDRPPPPAMAPPPGAKGAPNMPKGPSRAPVANDEDSVLGAIARGEIEILKARAVGKKVVFGCPFCSKPIEIKSGAQGKEMGCPDCSGQFVAPDLATGGEALPLSGAGGKAGEGVQLPGMRSHAGIRPGASAPAGAVALPKSDEEEARVAGDVASMSAHRLNADKIAKLVPRDEAEAGFDMEQAWASYPDAKPASRFWGKLRFLLILAMLGVIVAAVVASVIYIKRQQTEAKAKAVEIAEKKTEEKEGIGDTPARQALRVFEGFAEATTVRDRLPFVRNVENIESKMKLHYGRARLAENLPLLDPLSYQERELGGKNWARMDSLALEGERLRVYYFVRNERAALLDWESAVGYSEVELRDFSVSPPTRPVEMRVLLKASDYFNYDFADENALVCYELTDLNESAKVYGYAMRDSDTAKLLAQIVATGASPEHWTQAMVMLRVHDFSKTQDPAQVWVEKVLRKGWLSY